MPRAADRGRSRERRYGYFDRVRQASDSRCFGHVSSQAKKVPWTHGDRARGCARHGQLSKGAGSSDTVAYQNCELSHADSATPPKCWRLKTEFLQ